MRIVFMGTPDIARHALAELLRDGRQVVAVYTRADKPVGRKQIITPPPVKLLAAENRIPVYQPASLRGPGTAEELAALEPDLVVVVAYGMLLPPEVLAVPRHGCINLHVSLLPHYRGAAPIQWAVINGEKRTGVSVMQLDEGLDTGPVLAQQAFDIPPGATAGEVFELATAIGARVLGATINDIAAGRAVATPQQGEPSHAPMLKKPMAELDFARPAAELHNLVRGCNPWPLGWFSHQGSPVKVLRTRLEDCPGSAKPGEILGTDPLIIACGQGALELEKVHPAGSRAMNGGEWSAGRRFKAGNSVLG